MGTATEPKGAAAASEYLRWKKDVDQHDYAAASSYLSIRFGKTHAEKVAAELRKLPVITRRANDILRATGRTPLPLSDPGVLKDLKKVLAGQKLSPILVAESDIADGYHRLSLAYASTRTRRCRSSSGESPRYGRYRRGGYRGPVGSVSVHLP